MQCRDAKAHLPSRSFVRDLDNVACSWAGLGQGLHGCARHFTKRNRTPAAADGENQTGFQLPGAMALSLEQPQLPSSQHLKNLFPFPLAVQRTRFPESVRVSFQETRSEGNTNLVSRVMESYTSCPFLSPDLNQTHFSGTRNRPPRLENTQAGFTGKARTAAESRLAAPEAGKPRGSR